jgi:phenylpropionate dioxygenase-like ring-hydroxylating dioxygenase large terminal subunit
MANTSVPGTAARPGEAPEHVYQRLIADDVILAPSNIRHSSPTGGPSTGVEKTRYYDPAFHCRAVERMWSRVWQMACREEQIPEVGDISVYDVGDLSFIVTRVAPDEIKAYRNACLHRGTRLCESDTSVAQIRCRFHGFTWRLDGTLTKTVAYPRPRSAAGAASYSSTRTSIANR